MPVTDALEMRDLVRPCPVCLSRQGAVLHSQRFVLPAGHPLGDGYDVVTCARCGAAFADTSVPQAAYDAYYEQFSKYDDVETSTGGGGTESDAARLALTAATIAAHVDRGARVLDIGSAAGGLLAALREHGFTELVGVDPSHACVTYGERELELEMHTGTLAALPDIGRFDLIVLSHVLEHVEEVRTALAIVHGRLRPGGVLYLEVPDAMRYGELLIAPFQDFNTEHINHFSAPTLSNLAAQCSFTVQAGAQITIESTAGVPYPAVWQLWRREDGADPQIEPDCALRPELERYVAASQRMLGAIDERLESLRGREVVVWGTGQLALKLLAETALAGAHIIRFIDGNPVFHGTTLAGVPVSGPEDLHGIDAPVVIASTIHQDAIVRRIRDELGLNNEVVTLR